MGAPCQGHQAPRDRGVHVRGADHTHTHTLLLLSSFIVVARCCSLVSCRMVFPPCPWPGLRSESVASSVYGLRAWLLRSEGVASSVYGLRASMSLDFFVLGNAPQQRKKCLQLEVVRSLVGVV